MECFHVQTNQVFPLFSQFKIIKIGKFVEAAEKDINLIDAPNATIVSRLHVYLYLDAEKNCCDAEDQGSSNGTFVNGKQLVAFQKQRLKDGDCLNLGKEGQVTLIFRQQESADSINIPRKPIISTTEIPPETVVQVEEQNFSLDDFKNLNPRVSRFLGIAFLVGGTVYFSAIMQVGISFNAYVLILWGLGGYFLFQKKISNEWGYLLVGSGLLIMLVQGRVYAYTNLLGLLIAFGLFGLSYFFFENGKTE